MNKILAITIIIFFLGICVYMLVTTFIEISKLNKKLDSDTQHALDHLESLKYKLEDYGLEEDVKALDFAIRKIKQCDN